MAGDTESHPPDQRPPAAAPAAPARSSNAWKLAALLLALTTVGFAVWAFSLNSDLDDAEATIATQQKQLAAAPTVGSSAADLAGALSGTVSKAFQGLEAELAAVEAELGASEKEVAELESDIADAQAEAEAAAADLEDAAGDAKAEAEARAKQAEAKVDAARSCVQGYVASIKEAFADGNLASNVQQALADVQAMTKACKATLTG